jgi:hypothetical protein
MEELTRKGFMVGAPAAGYFRVGGFDIHTAKSAQQDPTGKNLVRGVMTRKPSELPKYVVYTIAIFRFDHS